MRWLAELLWSVVQWVFIIFVIAPIVVVGAVLIITTVVWIAVNVLSYLTALFI